MCLIHVRGNLGVDEGDVGRDVDEDCDFRLDDEDNDGGAGGGGGGGDDDDDDSHVYWVGVRSMNGGSKDGSKKGYRSVE